MTWAYPSSEHPATMRASESYWGAPQPEEKVLLTEGTQGTSQKERLQRVSSVVAFKDFSYQEHSERNKISIACSYPGPHPVGAPG